MTGSTLGRFEITDKLGEGGMGVLYRARDTRLGRTVAIKFLRPEVMADPARSQRFLQEAKAVSALNHPNIVTLHDIGEDETRGTWIAMECLDGESLRQRLARGQLAVPEAVRIALDVARGLAFAHAAGIAHRDIKPGNVMVTTSGLVKVLDFGLAKLAPSDQPATDSRSPTGSLPLATATGTILGTPGYMSPEQVEGRPADARSDVFSFGVMLYEMLTGRRPFEGASELSLNFCALTDLICPDRANTIPRRLLRRGLLAADNIFQLERLYAFNRKFFPEWRPRYLCVERLSDLPLVGLAYLHVEQLLVPPGPWTKRERKVMSH